MFVLLEDSKITVPNKCELRAIGTLWLTEDDLHLFEQELLKLRIENNCWAEFKFDSIDRTHLMVYEQLVKLFIESNAKLNMLIQREPSHSELKRFHDGDINKLIYKNVYLVIYHNYQSYKHNFCLGKKLYLLADDPILGRGDNRETLLEIFRNAHAIPIRKATKCKSHHLTSLQVTDVLTGLVLNYTANYYFPKEFPIKENIKTLIKALESVHSLKPRTTGRDSYTVKINNWLLRPGVTKRS